MEREFFDVLQKHSEAKLNVLNEYVIPWMRKLVLGRKFGPGSCLVIDGFAGAGIYEDDGKDGSPIILLKNAINFYEQAEQHGWSKPNIFLLFIEGLPENYKKLTDNIKELTGLQFTEENNKTFESLPDFPSIKVACLNDSFENAFKSLIDGFEKHKLVIPSFCFIDPFGFSHTPMELLSRYLKNDMAEIFLNLIYEETNRFIKHKNPKIQEHLSKLFGVEDLDELKGLIEDKSGQLRKEVVVDYYANQLYANTEVEHILSFEIKKGGKTKMILFYGTKSIVGLKVMKKAMWKVDDTGLYLFDDRKDIKQIQFEFVKELEDDRMINDLSKILYLEFAGLTKSIEEIEEFVLTSTIYPVEVYMKKALVLLENAKKIEILTNRSRRNTYPAGCRMIFL